MKSKLLMLAGISSLMLSLQSCWQIFGPEKSFVKEVVEKGFFNTELMILFILIIANLVIRAIKTGKENLFIGIGSIIVGIGLSYTILGTLSYWFFNLVISWGTIGIILWILGSAAQGFAPGFYGVIPVGLYFAYHDPRLLIYYGIPALGFDLLEAIIRKNPDV